MKLFKYIVVAVASLILLAACGEGFKASLSSSEAGELTAPQGEPDVEALTEQAPVDSRLNPSANELLKERIRGFEMNVEMDVSSQGAIIREVRGIILTDCQDFSNKVISRNNITAQQLYSGDFMFFGRFPNTELSMTFRCRDQACEQMTAIIYQTTSSADARGASVYYGLQALPAERVGTSSSRMVQKYVVQNVPGEVRYGFARTVADHWESCNGYSTAGTNNPTNNPVNQQTVIDSTSGSTFVPTSGTSTQPWSNSFAPKATSLE